MPNVTNLPAAKPARKATARPAAPAAPGGVRRRPAGATSPRPAETGRDETEAAVEPSSGNVFADLGFADAEDRLVKAQLARIVRHEVRARMAREGWTQARAAKLLGIAASDMSDLMRGNLARFAQERLEGFLTRLDLDVRIQVGPRPPEKARAEITVEWVTAFP